MTVLHSVVLFCIHVRVSVVIWSSPPALQAEKEEGSVMSEPAARNACLACNNIKTLHQESTISHKDSKAGAPMHEGTSTFKKHTSSKK